MLPNVCFQCNLRLCSLVRLQVYVRVSEIHRDPPEWSDQAAVSSAAAAAAKPWPAVSRLYQLRRALRVTLKRAAGTGADTGGDNEGGCDEEGGGGGDDVGEGGVGGEDEDVSEGGGGGERGGGGAARGYATATSTSAVAHELYRSLASEDTEEAQAPAALQCELRHYQRRALAFLLSRERAGGDAHPAEAEPRKCQMISFTKFAQCLSASFQTIVS